ncbi:MAG: hypothetical protein QNJ63_10030 [Calothrix sp. MO_192.B10]|nr:hypothetical protein [Calothrix sp. MO_192.B10]
MTKSQEKMNSLSYSLLEKYDGIDQANPETQALGNIISWEVQPKFFRIGRSAFQLLKKPIVIPGSDLKISSIKLKGVGARTHSGDIIKPTTLAVHNNNPHLGFNKHGDFIPVKSTPAPIGAITLERAYREFNVSKALIKVGCPSIIPISVYKYLDSELKFSLSKTKSEVLGVVVTGIPQNTYLRADSVFKYKTLDKKEQKKLNEWMKHLGIVNSVNPALSLITELSRLYGRTIRKFSEAGFYRYSGAPDNYSYCVDTGEVFLIDLDSSRLLEECSSIEKPLQIMRDAASGIAYLITFLTDPNCLHNFPKEQVLNYNPFKSFIMGYYDDINSEYIDSLSPIIDDFYVKVYELSHQNNSNYLVTNNDNKSFQQYLSNSFIRPWIDRKEIYSHLMPIFWLLHEKSNMMNYAPHQLSLDQIFQKISKYSSIKTVNSVKNKLRYCI